MPRWNVGLSKKVGLPQYGSKGVSPNLEAEVETHLLQVLLQVKEYQRLLFGMVRDSLEEELPLDGAPNPHRSRLVVPSPGSQESEIPKDPGIDSTPELIENALIGKPAQPTPPKAGARTNPGEHLFP